jgi:hypothetical protein
VETVESGGVGSAGGGGTADLKGRASSGFDRANKGFAVLRTFGAYLVFDGLSGAGGC